MPSNRGVVYLKPGSVEVQKIDFSTFRNPAGKTIDHGVILKVVTTNRPWRLRGVAVAPLQRRSVGKDGSPGRAGEQHQTAGAAHSGIGGGA